MTRSRTTRPSERGFSLLEVTVVVVVIALIAAIAIPGIVRWNEEYKLNTAAQQVADSLQATKMQAVSKARRTSLVFDVSGNRLGVEGSTLVNLPAGVRFAFPERAVAPEATVDMVEPVSFPPLPENASLRGATFTGRGLPDADPGEVSAVFLTNSTGSSAVLMTSAGNVRIVTWDGERWK